MIIGGGLIANAFKQQDFDNNLIVFASGVANSKGVTEKDCERELSLMKDCIKGNEDDKIVLYFSTYSIDNPQEQDSPYIKHKLTMETFLKNNAKNYLIIRTGNVVGKSNNYNTIFNYIFHKVKNMEQFELWIKAKRNFLDVDHLVLMVKELITQGYKNSIVYLLNPMDINIIELLNKMEVFLGKKAVFIPVEKESVVVGVDKTLSGELFKKLGISDENYVDKLIGKYCVYEQV